MKKIDLSGLTRVELISLAERDVLKVRRKIKTLQKIHASEKIVNDPLYSPEYAARRPDFAKMSSARLLSEVEAMQSFLRNPRTTISGYQHAETWSNVGALKNLGVIGIRPYEVKFDETELEELYRSTYHKFGRDKINAIEDYFRHSTPPGTNWRTQVHRYLKAVAAAEKKNLLEQYKKLKGKDIDMDEVFSIVRQAERTHSREDFYKVVDDVKQALEDVANGDIELISDERASELYPLVDAAKRDELKELSHNHPALYRGLLKSTQLIFEKNEDMKYYEEAFWYDD